MLLALLKLIGPPGSVGFLVLGATFALALWFLRARRAAKGWSIALACFYLLASLPVVANRVAGTVPADPSPDGIAALTGIDALIVLDGDNARGRVRDALRIYEAFTPGVVLVSGRASVMRFFLQRGVPPERMVLDSRSSTTQEQIDFVNTFIQERRLVKPVLVASRLSTPRIRAILGARQLQVVVFPSEMDEELPASGWGQWRPRLQALRTTRDSLYEMLAIGYYGWNGWIRRP